MPAQPGSAQKRAKQSAESSARRMRAKTRSHNAREVLSVQSAGALLVKRARPHNPCATMSLSSRLSAAPRLAVALACAGLISARVPAQAASAPAHDFTQADVAFVQGMIYHHAQAVVMSDWATSHGARADVATLCKRIALSQRDEITMMQHWLEARHLETPDPLNMLPGHSGPPHDESGMNMPGMNMKGMDMKDMDMGSQSMMMPGMLTPDQMRELDAAHGPAFDHLYLTGMIKHHEGALDMVKKLFDTPGSGQQPELFSFATDVDAGQRAEIGRMQAILKTLTPSPTQ